MNEKPLLSVIVTSYTLERLKDICELLTRLKSQTYPDIEIILVIERSMELVERVKAYIDDKAISSARVIFNRGEAGQSPARNLGITEARGDIAAFIDDDALPFNDWAEEIVRTYNNDSVVSVTGPSFPLWENREMSWFPEEFSWIVGGTAWFEGKEMRATRNVWGMNMSFRKKALDACRFTLGHKAADDGTKIGIEGEELDLSIRVQQETGKKIIFNPRVRVYHKVFKSRLTPKFIRRKAYWQGYTKAVIKKLYRLDKGQPKLLQTEYRLLRQILFQLLPSIGTGFFRHPVASWKRLNLTVSVLFHLTLGYFSANTPGLGWLTCRRYAT
jgi:glycosyltransferase involved in cell wall biosynthesis